MTKADFFPPIPPETPVAFLSSDHHLLEGRFSQGESNCAAIVCHPHPLYGGSYQNKVVDAAVRGFASLGYSTLRFNFRGVGSSEGTFGEAIAEVQDVEGGLRFLRERARPDWVVVAGFSFGSTVVSRFLQQGGEADGAFLIAPPLDSLGAKVFPVPARFGAHMILGGEDEYCSPMSFHDYQQQFETQIGAQLFDGVGHFFHGHLPRIVETIRGAFQP